MKVKSQAVRGDLSDFVLRNPAVQALRQRQRLREQIVQAQRAFQRVIADCSPSQPRRKSKRRLEFDVSISDMARRYGVSVQDIRKMELRGDIPKSLERKVGGKREHFWCEKLLERYEAIQRGHIAEQTAQERDEISTENSLSTMRDGWSFTSSKRALVSQGTRRVAKSWN